ncbi:MAG: phosphoribosylanthranilate isomerase [Ruminococcus sp.]|nr:phosphoribosylanthranilate isomerase [Ruminococcus sp.]
MKIKICGLKRNEDIEYVNEALPDYIGFVFSKSRRQVILQQAYDLKRDLNSRIKSVGVFVNEPQDMIAELAKNGIIDLAQLHGNEDNVYISKLREKTDGKVKIIKAISISNEFSIDQINEIDADFFLLDNGSGGTGKAFDYSLIKNKVNDRIFLAGGINAGNIKNAVSLNPYCIDVSSGAESDGIKDREKIIKLVRSIRDE